MSVNSSIDVMFRLSRISVTCWEGMEPKTGSIDEKFLSKKQTFASIATKFQARVNFIWLEVCIISLHCRHAHLPKCGFCEIKSLTVSLQVRTIQVDQEDKKILLYFNKSEKKNFKNMHSF